MKKQLKQTATLFCIALLCAITNKTMAQQNTYPVLSTSMESTCISNCFTADSLPYMSDSTVSSLTMTINLFDTINISSIQVKLGTSSGAGDLLEKTFTFDVSGSVGNNCTYSRTNYSVTLGLGNFSGFHNYFSEVKIERNNQSLTDAIIFNR